MGPKLIELRPNRQLLNPEFNGYKLSLENVVTNKKELKNSVERILLDSTQYSLLHVKLFGLQNHLIGETVDENDSVYYIDKKRNLCKTYIDPFNFELIDPIVLWQVPQTREKQPGNYNVTFKFVNCDFAVLTDGLGVLYLLSTGSRNDDDLFTIVYSGDVNDSDKGYIVSDAVYCDNNNKKEIHVVLLHVELDSNTQKYTTIINWVTLTEAEENWGQTALREIQVKGDVQYLTLEKNCKFINVVTDGECKFTLNSEHPIVEKNKDESKPLLWHQSESDVSLKILLPENFDKSKLNVVTTSDTISVKYEDLVWLNGNLSKSIDSNLTTWMVDKNNLEITLIKNGSDEWINVIKGNNKEEYVEINSIEEVANRLAHLTSETEANPPSGTTFNSQQIEDCDLEYDKTVIFERICGITNETVNKINIGSNPVLLSANINDESLPAFGIRHDVDVLLWKPSLNNEEFTVKHAGTLHAFGYIQASKQQKKYTVCSPDLNNIAICQSTRYVFLYCQKKAISSGELRNRSIGRYIPNMAQQYVINIPNEEVLGIYISNKLLFILADTFISVFKIE
ncbi:unnamed protein product [Brassicogethes aeneus]|uniref:NudC domain-containing protein 1 n=1 Tax=Brassicogethes aeneus TaxID=1431903 RepID=A0A9P0ASK2_BRAAE|nr:unnamed protein product [Brassicogethes aeneus]